MEKISCILLLFAYQCLSNTYSQERIITYTLNEEINNYLSEIIEEIRYVPLQSKEGFFIGRVTKVDQSDNNYFIYDRNNNSLFSYNNQGVPLISFSKKGKGPFEISRLSSFCLDRKNNLVILHDGSSRKELVFKNNGNRVSEKKTTFPSQDMCLTGSGNKAYYSGSSSFYAGSEVVKDYFFLTDKNDRLLNHFYNDPWKMHGMGVNSIFYYYRDTVIARVPFNDTIFYLSEKGLFPKYCIDFGKNRLIRSQLNISKISQVPSYAVSSHKYFINHYFVETSDWLVFDYSGQGKYFFGFVNKRNLQSWKFEYHNLLQSNHNPIIGNLAGGHDQNIFFIVEPIDFVEFIKHCESSFRIRSNFNEVKNKVKVDDNPILVIVTLRSSK